MNSVLQLTGALIREGLMPFYAELLIEESVSIVEKGKNGSYRESIWKV